MEDRDSLILFDSLFLAKLEKLHLLSRKIFQGERHAERRSRQTGSSMEFADYRNYTPGDDLRAVDWNVYGRLNRLFVKLFEAEQDLSVSFLLDCSASMRWRPETAVRDQKPAAFSKFNHARRIAAALAYVALANLDRVNIFPFGAELGTDLGFVHGKQQFHAALDFLRRLPAFPGATRMLPSFRSFAQRLKRRGLVFVLSDLFDPEAAEALQFLRQQQFEVTTIQTLDQAEIDPSLSGDLKLTDAETGVAIDALANKTLLDAYRREFAQFAESLERECLKRGIGFVQTTTAAPFEDLVLKVLRERQLVK